MRKTFKLLSVVFLLFAFISCDDDDEADRISFSDSVLRFPSGSDRISLIVESNVPFGQIKATSVADWIQVDALEEGHQFVVTVPANPNPDVRQAVIVVKAGNCVKELDVLQEARPVELELTAETGKCWDLNTQVAIGIRTKELWEATVSAGDWFLLGVGGSDKGETSVSGNGDACIYAFFEPNTTQMERRGEVTVKLKNGTERHFSFVQSAALPELGREGDSLALVAIYKKYDGAKNWKGYNWLTPGLPVDKWNGVFVDEETGRVDKVLLSKDFRCDNGGGDLPEEIKNLTKMTTFTMINNGYDGKLPYELLRCSELSILNIKGCKLQGILEPWIGSFGWMSQLELEATGLTGSLPYELQAIYALQTLNLASNEFTGEIPACWNMLYLNKLYLSYNQLSGVLPLNIPDMRYITYLHLEGNADLVGELTDNFCARVEIGSVYEYSVTGTGVKICTKE